MIKFFRNIRKSSISEGKTAKYLKYAIGEVLLVMIGILLALQVNNWNNRKIEKTKEQTILKNLQVDFINNIENLDNTYKSFTEAYNASTDLLEIVKDTKVIIPGEVEQLVDDIINKTNSYDLITGAINEIFNTGSLHLISDPVLRKQISNWSYYYTDTEDDIVIYRAYLFDFFIPSLTSKVRLRNMAEPAFFEVGLYLKKISESNFKVDYERTIRNLEFENELYNNTLNYMYVLNSYKVFHSYLKDTLKQIEASIK